MKIARMLGYAGLATMTLAAAVPATAQYGFGASDDRGYQDQRRDDDRGGYYDRGFQQRYDDGGRYDERRYRRDDDRGHRGWRDDRPRCRIVWRYERPVRLCR